MFVTEVNDFTHKQESSKLFWKTQSETFQVFIIQNCTKWEQIANKLILGFKLYNAYVLDILDLAFLDSINWFIRMIRK